MKVLIDKIVVLDGRRKIDENHVKNLSESIKELNRLIQPITITKEYILIGGNHRLEAHKLLGWNEIEANIMDLDDLHRRLAEIDENTLQKEMSYIERGELLKERKEIYEALYPETKAGGDRKSDKIKQRNPLFDKLSFVDDTSQKSGISPTIIREEIQIAKNLSNSAKEAVKKVDMSKRETLKLSRMEDEKQDKIASQLESGEAKSVAEAEINLGETKFCSCCETEKPLSEFSVRTDTGKHRSWCNECRQKKRKASKESNADIIDNVKKDEDRSDVETEKRERSIAEIVRDYNAISKGEKQAPERIIYESNVLLNSVKAMINEFNRKMVKISTCDIEISRLTEKETKKLVQMLDNFESTYFKIKNNLLKERVIDEKKEELKTKLKPISEMTDEEISAETAREVKEYWDLSYGRIDKRDVPKYVEPPEMYSENICLQLRALQKRMSDGMLLDRNIMSEMSVEQQDMVIKDLKQFDKIFNNFKNTIQKGDKDKSNSKELTDKSTSKKELESEIKLYWDFSNGKASDLNLPDYIQTYDVIIKKIGSEMFRNTVNIQELMKSIQESEIDRSVDANETLKSINKYKRELGKLEKMIKGENIKNTIYTGQVDEETIKLWQDRCANNNQVYLNEEYKKKRAADRKGKIYG